MLIRTEDNAFAPPFYSDYFTDSRRLSTVANTSAGYCQSHDNQSNEQFTNFNDINCQCGCNLLFRGVDNIV